MKFLLSLLLLFGLTAKGFADPVDFRENIVALHKAKHPWAVFALSQADRAQAGTKIYGDFGQWQSMAWVATGDKKYVAPAAAKLTASITAAFPTGPNEIRENFIDWCLLYEWLKPGMTPEQNAACRAALTKICEWCFEIGTPQYRGGWRYGDSDQTTGQYLGLVLADRVLGTEWAKRPEAIKARETLRTYVDKSAGGEWIESSKYNLGTLSFLLMGAYAIDVEQFPEVKALVPQIVEMQLAAITPDGKAAYQWGSEEEPRTMAVDRRVKLWAMLAGITRDARLYAALDQLTATGTPKSYLNLGWRALYLFEQQAGEPSKPAGNLRISLGNGHFLYKRGGALLGVHFSKRLDVHHEVMYAADLQLYLDGEWVLTRPLGYGGPAVSGEAGNSPLFAGLSSMQTRGPVTWGETSAGCEMNGFTSGSYYAASYYDRPPAFVEHFRRIIYTFPGKLSVSDRFKGNKPARIARYRQPDQDAIAAAPALWQQVWHCPEKPSETGSGFTWKTPGGKTMRLTAPAGCKRLVIDEAERWGASTNFRDSELKWQIRFLSDEPVCEMTTTLEVK